MISGLALMLTTAGWATSATIAALGYRHRLHIDPIIAIGNRTAGHAATGSRLSPNPLNSSHLLTSAQYLDVAGRLVESGAEEDASLDEGEGKFRGLEPLAMNSASHPGSSKENPMSSDGFRVRPDALHSVADLMERAARELNAAGAKPVPAMDAGQAQADLNRLVSTLSGHAGGLVAGCQGVSSSFRVTASAYHTRDQTTGSTFDDLGGAR